MNPQMSKTSALVFILLITGLAIFLATLLQDKTYPAEPSRKKLREARGNKYGREHDLFCIFRITFHDMKNVEKIQTSIMELITEQTFLLNLHIAPPEDMPDTISPFLRNRLLEWKYLRKGEHLLHVIPVDFNLLTFHMLEYFNEETNVDLPPFRIKDENKTCELRNDYSTIVNVLGYIYILTNYTSDFMFCTLKFDEQGFKDTLYYFTTIWVGYDMLCAEPKLESIKNPKVSRKKQSFLSPLMCFLLALECVWFFKLIEIHEGHTTDNLHDQLKEHENIGKQHDSCSSDDQQATTDVKSPDPRRKTYQSKCTCYYFPHERPYGLNRLVKKIFHAKITPHKCLCDACCFYVSCKQDNSISRSLFVQVINLPSLRFFTALYIFLLFPISVYRTVGRKALAHKEYRNYKNVVRASEPICNIISSDDDIIFLCDWVYAVFGSLVGVVLFIYHHYNISENGYRIFSPSLGYQDVRATTVCDKLMSRLGILSDLLRYMSDQAKNFVCWACITSSRIPHRHKAVKVKRSQEVSVTRSTRKTNRLVVKCVSILYFLLALAEFPFQLLLCLLPIIPFSIHHFMKALSHRKCVKILIAFILLVLTIVSFRTIISSFLFLFRTLTVILFIVLPVREYIFKYFMLGVSVFIYLIYYYNEVMDLLKAILIYVCTLNKEKSGENYIEQDLFDRILRKLVFFKTKIYFAVFKLIVVTSYIFITIEALTVGKKMGVLEFVELTQYGLIFGSPYILSIFLKSGKQTLNYENKKEVQKIFKESEKSDHVKQKFEMHHALISSCLHGCLTKKENFMQNPTNASDNVDVKIPLQSGLI